MSQMLFLILIIDIIILVCLLQNKYKQNENLKDIVILICSQLYNFILGYYSYTIAFMLACLNLAIIYDTYLFYVVMVIVLLPIFFFLLVPLNRLVKKKVEVNLIIYIIATIITFTIGFVTFWLSENYSKYI